MASLSLTAGNGDNGLVPSSRSAMHLSRSVRQATDKQGCKELEQLWEAFNKSADATAQKFSDNLKTEPAANTTAILASICARFLTHTNMVFKLELLGFTDSTTGDTLK